MKKQLTANDFKEVIRIDTPYRPGPGSYCKPKEFSNGRWTVHQWFYCREIWHGHLYLLKLFFYSHRNGRGDNVAAFMRKVEDMLHVYPRSEFGPTQRKTIMWVRPSVWWTKPTMRRSLFTILLRAGEKYNPALDNFYDALYSDPYTDNTRYAVARFLNGHTIYKGKRKGWYNQFYLRSPSHEEIDLLLVKQEAVHQTV